MKSELDTELDAVVAAITAPGGQLGVTTANVRGATMPVFGAAPPSMREFLAFFFMANGPKEFLVFGAERLTFADVYARALEMAAMLQHRQGIAKGDRVAIAMRNYPEWVIAYVAIAHLGAVAVPMNAWWTAEELNYGLSDSGARLIIADEERARRVAKADCHAKVLTVRTAKDVAEGLGAQCLEEELAASPKTTWYLPEISPEDDVSIMYTSGSTGSPKGAVSTHRAQVSGTMNYLVAGLALLELTSRQGAVPAEQQVMLLNVPLFHITGLVPVLLVSVCIGRKMIIMHKWDAGEALKLIEKEKVTYFVGVPTMSLELMQHPDHDKYDLSTLVDIASGGAPRPPEHVERLAKTFPGKQPVQGYGLTETNGVGTGNFRGNYRAKPASAGRAAPPLVEIRIADGDGAVGDGAARRQRRRSLHPHRRQLPRLLDEARSDGRGLRRRWLVPHRRPWVHGRRRLSVHRRPQEGHHHPRRREHQLPGGRIGALHPSGGRRGERLRPARRAAGRDRRGGGLSQAGFAAGAGCAARFRRKGSCRVQDSGENLDQHRAVAQARVGQDRQGDAAPPLSRGIRRQGGVTH